MDLAMQIGAAVLMGMMVIFMWPRAKAALANPEKGSKSAWLEFVVLIAIVTGFVVLLVKLV